VGQKSEAATLTTIVGFLVALLDHKLSNNKLHLHLWWHHYFTPQASERRSMKRKTEEVKQELRLANKALTEVSILLVLLNYAHCNLLETIIAWTVRSSFWWKNKNKTKQLQWVEST